VPHVRTDLSTVLHQPHNAAFPVHAYFWKTYAYIRQVLKQWQERFKSLNEVDMLVYHTVKLRNKVLFGPTTS
jgi:hypothetical protein